MGRIPKRDAGKRGSKRQAAPDYELVDAALRAYLKDGKSKSVSWIKHPNNLISVVAITISILGVMYGFYKDHRDSINRDQQSLSSIVSDLNKLDEEQANAAGGGSGELGRIIANRRLSLLADADRLTGNLGAHAPRAQLAVLGAAYVQDGEVEKAIKYFKLVTEEPATPYMRISAWRSLAYVYESLGPKNDAQVRDAFKNAVGVAPDATDPTTVNQVVQIYLNASDFEYKNGRLPEAFEQIALAKAMAAHITCAMGGATLARMIDANLVGKQMAFGVGFNPAIAIPQAVRDRLSASSC